MPTTYKFPTIKLGSTGGHVGTVQAILRANDCKGENGLPLEIDNSAGRQTMFAVKTYIRRRREQGVDLGGEDAWGPLCYADQNWPKA